MGTNLLEGAVVVVGVGTPVVDGGFIVTDCCRLFLAAVLPIVNLGILGRVVTAVILLLVPVGLIGAAASLGVDNVVDSFGAIGISVVLFVGVTDDEEVVGIGEDMGDVQSADVELTLGNVR